MKYQIDIMKVKRCVVKYLPYIVIIILMMLLLLKFNNINKLTVQKEVLKNKISESEKNIAMKVKDNVNAQKRIVRYKDTIAFIVAQNEKKQTEIDRLNKERGESSSKVSRYSHDQLTEFYIARYKANNKVFKTNLGVELEQSIARSVALDLTDYDYVDKLLVETTDMLANEKDMNILKDSVITDLEYKDKNNFFIINQKDVVIVDQKDIIKAQEKIIKKETRKNKLLKYALPISIVAGVLTGVIITK